jgi:hypothetical protein
MKKKYLLIAMVAMSFLGACDVVKSVATQAANDVLTGATTGTTSTIPALTQTEAAGGLKDALVNGVLNGTGALGKVGAFASNPSIKILLPAEVQSIEQKIRDNYLLNAAIGKELDKTIDAMNSGAEKSMKLAVPVFKNAITNMSFADAMKILTGGSGAATAYLKSSSEAQLQQLFMPEVKKALDEVALSKTWTPVVNKINQNKTLLGLKADIQPDLNKYVTEKATAALFTEIEKEENKIRKDPVSRTTDLLKKAFDYADKH